MLTMKYQGHQRGPMYTFQIESPVPGFLTNDLIAIAFKSADVPRDFTYASAEDMASARFLVGNLTSTYADDAINVISVSFQDNEGLLNGADTTISLLRRVATNQAMTEETEDNGFQAIAHFTALIYVDEWYSTSVQDNAGAAADDLRECKFDTLTFEQLGPIVRMDRKQGKMGHYHNVHTDNFQNVRQGDDNPLHFPTDIFDDDAPIYLPQKK